MELLRFGNSGTECVQYALRFARAFTGREKIVRFEGHYHGWSDAIHWSGHPGPNEWGSAAAPTPAPGSSGMPAAVAGTLIVAGWNDTAALERIFTEQGNEIAAVITEPILGNCGGIMPAPGYLRRMRELTAAHGAVLIFDEVLTGFRVAPGGAQELLDIRPDLTVLAKALGAGVPVAAVGGRREIVEMVTDGRTMHGGTYNSSPLVCAAVIAAARATGAEGFYDDLDARGAPARRRPRRRPPGMPASRRAGAAPARSSSSGSPPARRPTTAARTRSSRSSPFPTLHAELREPRRSWSSPRRRGSGSCPGAHSDADVDRTLEAAAEAMPAVAAAAERGEVGPRGGVR